MCGQEIACFTVTIRILNPILYTTALTSRSLLPEQLLAFISSTTMHHELENGKENKKDNEPRKQQDKNITTFCSHFPVSIRPKGSK
jgi:hypothetical protein